MPQNVVNTFLDEYNKLAAGLPAPSPSFSKQPPKSL